MNTSNGARVDLRYTLERADFSLDVALEVPMRGITGIFGESGSGKTTVLRCVAGLERPSLGKLVVDGEVWQDQAANISRPIHERRIAYVFQEPRLFWHLNVRQNLEYGQRRTRAQQNGFEFDQIVDLLGLGKLLHRVPAELSGGEAQRVAIARALLRAPRLMLMDEPLAALDRTRKDEILPFLDRLHAQLSVPILYVSHNIEEVCRLCDHLVVMEGGRVLAAGEIQSVLVRLDLPLLVGEDAGSVIRCTVKGYDTEYELTRLGFSGGMFIVPGRFGEPGAKLRLRIRANDVSLCRERPRSSTILNIIPATVERIRPVQGPLVMVRLVAGSDRLTARITRRSCDEMDLKKGDQVLVQIKAVAVR